MGDRCAKYFQTIIGAHGEAIELAIARSDNGYVQFSHLARVDETKMNMSRKNFHLFNDSSFNSDFRSMVTVIRI